MTRRQQSLNGEWMVRAAQEDGWLPAQVPGGVHTDLLAAGRIADPFVGYEELHVQWVPDTDWEYRRTFDLAPELAAAARIDLVCDGLDTLAEVWLNGQLLGVSDNMFCQRRWDARPWLRPEGNELVITFQSATRYAAARQRERPFPEVNDPLPGAPYLRKAPSHFGWDWGPRLAPVGIWQPLRLEADDGLRLDDVQLRQHHTADRVTITAQTVLAGQSAAPVLELHVTAPGGSTQQASMAWDASQPLSLDVVDPQLWWPNGYGAQPLYTIGVRLLDGETVLDTRTFQLGLRTIELRQELDQWGRSFEFVVNGVPIFAKGANWIPADSFPTRVSHAQLDHLLGSAALAHHTMLRIWGGGFYEDEYLYDLCDRLGLLVWQDFMFACAIYPLHEPAMLETLRPEVAQAVRRLRHRTCLALWCGNNEIETAWVDWGWDRPEYADLKAAYAQFFHETLPAWVAEDDADHAYWPSSPSSGVPFEAPNGGAAGDIHQWTVWHALQPFQTYRATPARFVSEFGFQSLPTMATVASYARPEDWNMTSFVMEHHQKNRGGNGRIVTYMTDHFRMPCDFPALVYLSQLLQAEAMRIGVEHWRRDPACAGALYWQLNDCWPVASWAGIDYAGRWKALHYASRRFFAPLLLSVEDTPEQARINLINEQRTAWSGEVRWSLETLAGAVRTSGAHALSLAPLSSQDVASVALDGLEPLVRQQVVLVTELWQGAERTQLAVTPLLPSKHLALTDPQLSATVSVEAERLHIVVHAHALARFVDLALDGADVIFSDNYFDLPAGRSLRISCPLPAGWSIDQARAALQVRSLVDSF